MEAREVDFVIISESIYGVLRWFMEALQSLSGVRYRESQGVAVVLEGPREEHPHEPGVVADIVIPASRVTTRYIWAEDWPPETVIERFDPQTVPLEPVIRFRFAILDDETYGIARCDERLPSPAQKDFLDFLKKIQARYPETGPFWQEYATRQTERKKEDLKAKFIAASAPVVAGVEGGPVMVAEQAVQPSLTEAAIPKRRRGRKTIGSKEINQICVAWLEVQDKQNQDTFCNMKAISSSTLRRWLKSYPYPES